MSYGGRPWSYGGRPWSFWEKSGQFLYVFGEAPSDEDRFVLTRIKIGITTDPKVRLRTLRIATARGIWHNIQWIESSAHLIERALHELLSPWRCAFEREWFLVPGDILDWLTDGMDDRWYEIGKHDSLFGEDVRSVVTEIIPNYYGHRWLDERLKQMRK